MFDVYRQPAGRKHGLTRHLAIQMLSLVGGDTLVAFQQLKAQIQH